MPVAKYLGLNILAWSVVLACHALCFSFPALIAVRTLLGIFEAVCQPAFLIMTSLWYKREEQASIVTYWYMMSKSGCTKIGLLFANLVPQTVCNRSLVASWPTAFHKSDIQASRVTQEPHQLGHGRPFSSHTAASPFCGDCSLFGGFPTALCAQNAGLKKTRS